MALDGAPKSPSSLPLSGPQSTVVAELREQQQLLMRPKAPATPQGGPKKPTAGLTRTEQAKLANALRKQNQGPGNFGSNPNSGVLKGEMSRFLGMSSFEATATPNGQMVRTQQQPLVPGQKLKPGQLPNRPTLVSGGQSGVPNSRPMVVLNPPDSGTRMPVSVPAPRPGPLTSTASNTVPGRKGPASDDGKRTGTLATAVNGKKQR